MACSGPPNNTTLYCNNMNHAFKRQSHLPIPTCGCLALRTRGGNGYSNIMALPFCLVHVHVRVHVGVPEQALS